MEQPWRGGPSPEEDGKFVLLFPLSPRTRRAGWSSACVVPPAPAEPRGGQLLSHTFPPVAVCLRTSCIALPGPAAAAPRSCWGLARRVGLPPLKILQTLPAASGWRQEPCQERSPGMLGWLRHAEPAPVAPQGKLSANLPELERDRN